MSTHEATPDDHHDPAEHTLHQPPRLRPHSIDESLELERQLMDEPLSPTRESSRPISLDPHVLSTIVAGLRQSLADMTKERDGLVESLTGSHAREAELKDALSIVSEKCNALDNDVVTLRLKSQADDEAIAMLRTKVEESRRGLMRLQTESRRMSQISNLNVDTARASPSAFSFGGAPASSKRASFAPLTGSAATRISAHRRVSSVSDPAYTPADHTHAADISASTSPDAQTLTFPDVARGAPPHTPTPSSRRISGFFGRTSPPNAQPDAPDAAALHLEALRRELAAARVELEDARHEAAESNEAREASELCVKALRNFISENAIGDNRAGAGRTAVKLPPPPSDATGPEDPAAKKAVGGWSALKLWRVDTTTSRSSADSASSALSPISVAEPTMQPPPAHATAVPLTRKIGGFFSSRASVASSSASQHAPHSHQQDAMFNGSDCSSIDESEPISPRDAGLHGAVLVRDHASTSSDMASILDPPGQTKSSIESQHRPDAQEIGVAHGGD